jgi:hypothetical protein
MDGQAEPAVHRRPGFDVRFILERSRFFVSPLLRILTGTALAVQFLFRGEPVGLVVTVIGTSTLPTLMRALRDFF